MVRGGRHVSMDARLRLVTGSKAIQEPHWWHWSSCQTGVALSHLLSGMSLLFFVPGGE